MHGPVKGSAQVVDLVQICAFDFVQFQIKCDHSNDHSINNHRTLSSSINEFRLPVAGMENHRQKTWKFLYGHFQCSKLLWHVLIYIQFCLCRILYCSYIFVSFLHCITLTWHSWPNSMQTGKNIFNESHDNWKIGNVLRWATFSRSIPFSYSNYRASLFYILKHWGWIWKLLCLIKKRN